MLRKLAAVLVLVGLGLPYAGDVRPVTDAWQGSAADVLRLAVPLLAATLYGLRELAAPIAAALERGGPTVHGALRATYLVLAGGFLLAVLGQDTPKSERLGVAVALLVTGVLLVWQQGRGTKAQRVPLLLLAIVGLPALVFPVATRFGLQVGGWLVTGGWVLGIIEEVRLLRATPPVVRGG